MLILYLHQVRFHMGSEDNYVTTVNQLNGNLNIL